MSDFSFEAEMIKNAVCDAAHAIREAQTAPHVLYKPALFPDGNMWCALLGDDLMVGVAGFGETPAKAMAAFDKAWHETRRLPKQTMTEDRIHPDSQFGMGA